MNLTYLTEETQRIAMETAEFLLLQRKSFDPKKVETKRAHDYVSYVDKQSEKRLVEQLHALLPEAGFITEEGSAVMKGEPYCWVIDPLDGTTNFIHGHAPYCVSIALRNRQETLLGVVCECTHNELFWANKESKAYLNGQVIHSSAVKSLDNAFVQLGLPYDAESYRSFLLKLMQRLYGHVGGIRVCGSAAAETCYVAMGRFDARMEAFLGPWDIAAGTLILEKAGGLTTDFGGGDNYHSGHTVLSSNALIHQQLLQLISACGQDFL